MTRPPAPDRPSMPNSSVIAAVVVVLAVLAAVIYLGQRDDSPGTAKAAAAPSPTAAPAPAPTSAPSPTPSAAPARTVKVGPCTYTLTADPAAKPATPPTAADLRSGPVTATITTTVGALTVTLDGAKAPCATASFVSLARQGYYDGSPCHRLVTDPSGPALLQCGDPTGTGTGGPGYEYAEEGLSGATYPAGTVAIAKTQDPNTSGSQFFIVIADVPLSPDYTPIGKVTAGLNTLLPVAAAGSTPDQDGKPNTPVSLTKVTTSG